MSRTPQDVHARFWSKVENSTSGCWLWKGGRFHDGYGQFKYNNRTSRAHRVAWQLIYGPIPDGLLVCHHCDIPLCVAPQHLFLGTVRDNYHDMERKGRAISGDSHWTRRHPEKVYRGEQNGNAKLTALQVEEIRALKGHKFLREVAPIYKISMTHVSYIWREKAW